LSRTQQKALPITTSKRASHKHLQVYEAIMNQTPSHSQTPEFDTNKSQTTSVLFQPPKPEEMRLSRRAQFEADAKDFGLFIGVSLVMWLFITFFLAYVIGG
jgi:hypothetical protein